MASDRLILVSDTAASALVQHTVMTDRTLVWLTLPAASAPESTQVRFGGTNKTTFTDALSRRPGHISLWSGSMFARYRQALSAEPLGAGQFRLRVPSIPQSLNADLHAHEQNDIESVQTWILPEKAELVAWSVDDPDPTGDWTIDDNTIAWTQHGLASHELTIDFSLPPTADTTDTIPPPTLTAALPVPADIDKDGVPDERDICLQSDTRHIDSIDALGCSTQSPRILDDVRFRSGRSALDLKARQQLDRAAKALLALPDTQWEIAGFTDNDGAAENNRRLSARRAEAVRHYLLLRGTPAGQLRSRGYGEDAPIADNASAEGRWTNRRIELREWSDTTVISE